VHIVAHATELELSPVTAASIITVIGGASIVGRITMGITADRISKKSAYIICFIMVASALLWLAGAKEAWMLYLFAALFGFAYGGHIALGSLIIADLFGLGSHGVIFGSVIVGATIGGAIGPFVTGSIFDIMHHYQLAFLISAGMALIGLILALFIRPITGKGGTNDS
ncbi:MFS transporter, partial [Chloroflexota bacterium]